MRFSESYLRQLRDRVSIVDYAGRRLAWDKRKSRPAAGDYWACCPFHTEKSASFHVLDAKGVYKCFGCGESGDVINLSMKLEGLAFPEAVARLAESAGMALPVDEHEDREASDRRKRLFQAAARAGLLYAEALEGRDGKEARAYLSGRGFDRELCRQFGIGFAPDSWTWLIERLGKEGFSVGELIEAGLARDGDGRRPIDTFRNRITFEIADAAGKVVAFGARALAKDAKAKYINSPESALFHKGRTLYRLKQARETAARSKAAGLVVAEGYFDVIAFERAGIPAVAPMGTALTEDQLQLIWRAGPEPVLCFDGDVAGKRAADRALDLALPHLGPAHTVRIAFMPEGQDPDDVFNRAGPEALASMLAAAAPAADALFAREQRGGLATPEAAAAFKERLRAAAGKIADAETRKLYLSRLLSQADALLRARRAAQGQQRGRGGGRFEPAPQVTAELRAKAAAAGASKGGGAEQFLRIAVDYPDILSRYGEWLDRLDCPDRDLGAVRDAVLALSHAEEAGSAIDREALAGHLTRSGEERAAARVLGWPKGRARGPDAIEPGTIEAEWLALITRETVLPAIKEEMAELRARADAGDEAAFARFQALGREARALEAAALEVKLDEPAADDLVA